jgi:hypothetical protein
MGVDSTSAPPQESPAARSAERNRPARASTRRRRSGSAATRSRASSTASTTSGETAVEKMNERQRLTRKSTSTAGPATKAPAAARALPPVETTAAARRATPKCSVRPEPRSP